MKELYVVYRDCYGEIQTTTVQIEGKINHYTVDKAVRDSLTYDELGSRTILSWQEEDGFTFEESKEFWENYNK